MNWRVGLLCLSGLFLFGCEAEDEGWHPMCRGRWCSVDAPPRDSDPCPPNAHCSQCSVLFQTGCNAGDKCSWVHDDESAPPIGHVGCVAEGSVLVGGACVYGAPGATGFDDCIEGAVCVAGVCEAVCDHQGGAPMCGVGFTCVRVDGLFGPAGGPTPPAAGVCESS